MKVLSSSSTVNVGRCNSLLLVLLLLVVLHPMAAVVVAAARGGGEPAPSLPSFASASAQLTLDEKKRESVMYLVEAALRAANAESLEEILAPEEMETLLALSSTTTTTKTMGGGAVDGGTHSPALVGQPGVKEEEKARSPSCDGDTTTGTSGETVVATPKKKPISSTGTIGTMKTPTRSTKTTTTTTKVQEEEEDDDDNRRARLIAEAPNDYDCMEREFDVRDPSFDYEEAVRVYAKCRIVVLRNLYTSEQMERFKKLTEDFVVGLHEKRVDPHSPMINGNQRFFKERTQGKWEVLHPDYFLEYAPDFATEPILRKIVTHPLLLGPDAVFGGSGALLAQPGTAGGHWHTDGLFLLGEDSKETFRLAGHDMPPHAINTGTPLVNITADSGPTEFCIGTSHMAGIESLQPKDESLANDRNFNELWHGDPSLCPPNNWRVPLVNPGDMILWDYLIRHRSGGNTSDKLRPLLFSAYGRDWFQDANFAASGMGLQTDEDYEFLAPREMADAVDPYKLQCRGRGARVGGGRGEQQATLCDLTEEPLTPLTSIKKYFPEYSDYEDDYDLYDGRIVIFDVGNKDVDDAVFIVELQGGQKIPVPPGYMSKIQSRSGTKLWVEVDGMIVKSWKLIGGQTEIIISRQSLQLPPSK